MGEPDLPGWVQTAASDPHLQPLWAALAVRYGEGGRATRTVTVSELDDAARRAVADLLRLQKLPPASVTIPVAKIADAYQLDDAELRRLVEVLCGPIGDRAADRAAARRAREAAADKLAEPAVAVADRHPWMDREALIRWASSQARAVGGDLTRRVDDVETVLAVAAAADPNAAGLLPVVAARIAGDPHALDTTRPLGRLLDAALAAADTTATADAGSRRLRRRRIGLIDDELSSTVMTWQLPIVDAHPYAPMSRHLDRDGQASVWTLAQLRGRPLQLTAGRVLVVENPAVLATATARDVPYTVVCTSGVPSVAALTLLDAAAAAGCRIDVHADLDPAGLRIVTALLDRLRQVRPWLMDAGTYLRHLDDGSAPFKDDDDVVVAAWDRQLEAAMGRHRRRVFEEQLIDDLLSPPRRERSLSRPEMAWKLPSTTKTLRAMSPEQRPGD